MDTSNRAQSHTKSTAAFVTTTFVVFCVATIVLAWIDFLPEPQSAAGDDASFEQNSLEVDTRATSSESSSETQNTPSSSEEIEGEVLDESRRVSSVTRDAVVGGSALPTRILIDSIDVDATIQNPSSTNVEVLDNALLKGVVRYPESGTLHDTSNLFLFGHSSGLPVIHNQNFKVFNRLKELTEGDLIRIQSGTEEHLYRVETVRLTKAEEAFISLDNSEKRLTLSTCNTFGEKSERYVVEASFIGAYPIKTQ